ncbi:MAG: type II toxin-antitoxin system RelE/ParE family toxin [Phycisphaerae bacterium]|nr:type II toxin-antitoxin system RelE/ParE family toxin [Phycisphaerae bacterium]
MAHRLIWSPESLDDLDALAEYIARDSRIYAGRMVRRIREAAQHACRFPEIGRVVPEIERESVREIIVSPYRLIYSVESDRISVIAVIHGARLLSKAIRGRST